MAKRDDEDDDIDVDDENFDEPPKRRTGVTTLTLALCVLNILAAAGFFFLLAMDYSKRQAWSNAVFKHDLALMGLPLEEETGGPSASRATFPKMRVDDEQLKNAFNNPQRGGKRVSEKFEAAVLNFDHPIQPQHLTSDFLNDWFKGLGEPVKTLEDEIRRTKKVLPGEIAQAAEGVPAAAKTEADKRNKLATLILGMAYTIPQIDVLDKKLKELPKDQLDPTLKDASQRWLLFQILAPLEMRRPAERAVKSGPPEKGLLESAADLAGAGKTFIVPLDELYKLLEHRLNATLDAKYDGTVYFGKDWAGETRDTIDKRQAIAYILFTLSQVKRPDGAPLYSSERLQAVIGLHEYALAAQRLTGALLGIHERIVAALKVDRDGSIFQAKGKLEKNLGFVERYQQEIARIQALVETIKKRRARYVDLQEQLKSHEQIVKDRQEQVGEITKRLVGERVKTADLMKQLKELQQEVFKAKLDLVGAQRENLRLEDEIRRWESRKGARAP